MRVRAKGIGIGAAVAIASSLLLAGPASAAPPSGFVCSGTLGSPAFIPGGTYQRLTMPPGSLCLITDPVTIQTPTSLGSGAGLLVESGGLTIRGPFTVGPGAAFGADLADETAPVEIDGPLTVQNDGAFYLGTEIPYGPIFATIGGPVRALGASAVVIQNVRIGGPASVQGGGADNAIVDAINPGGVGFNNYTDFEDDQIGGPLTETGYQGVWAGVIRSKIQGPLTFTNNVEATIDQYDIGSDIIYGPATCADNTPAPNTGNGSVGAPSIVYGPTRGNQAATCTGVPSGITGPPPA